MLKQIGEQFLHLTVFGGIAYLSTEVSIALLCYREFSSWWAPWPFKGQWPPGDPGDITTFVDEPVEGTVHEWPVELHRQTVTQMSRVEDLRLDVVVSLGGIAIGNVVARVWPVWELIG